ncbi:iron-sulfur cluster insertion protein ErpA [Buchnera aphidicola (Aphis craccivora)]|nr:iron-sulfur cluster insertion protein ErpA [Buchnera aphidicola]QCI16466.1 iron-sulfur cluster insertion protein ErpA [Buchnera aphidicola (Aphis craccivora)]QLL40604.1 iron-sulfur cluster insertion protein ErpA [Buchnera aphidicola (Aphis craccivore)]WAI17976.1 MAG: iron-sulfur cluster insertion protein ErpA [Buchnera aphidicola (Aphis craccivora)]
MKNIINNYVKLTQTAIKKIKNFILIKKNKNLKLRIYIIGGGCSGFQYQFTFDENINEDDMIINQENIFLIIDPISLQYLKGGEIDYIENLEGSKFIVNNPNAKNTCGCGSSFNI